MASNPFTAQSKQGQGKRNPGPPTEQKKGNDRPRNDQPKKLWFYPKAALQRLVGELPNFREDTHDKSPASKFGHAEYQGNMDTIIQFCSRNERFEGKRIRISVADKRSSTEVASFVNVNFHMMRESDTVLNLSDLPQNLDWNITNSYTLSFLFFIVSCFCEEEEMNVEQIIFERNILGPDCERTFGPAFQNAFPHCRRIYIAGTEGFPRRPRMSGIEFVDIPRGRVGDSFSSNPFQIATPPEIRRDTDTSSVRRVFRLDQFTPVVLDPNVSPVNAFIVAFFHVAAQNIGDIGEFYSDDAQFSITIDICRSDSPLAQKFMPSDCNLLRLKNCVFKHPKISEWHKSVFPHGFWAHPTSFHWATIGANICGLVIRGVFQLPDETLFMFHRSFTLVMNGGKIFIVADNMYIQEPR